MFRSNYISLYITLFCVFLLLTIADGFAAESAGHQVTVAVVSINQVAISGGDVNLVVDQYTENKQIQSRPNTDTTLVWETNEKNRKITVATNLSEPLCLLTVEAASFSSGTNAWSAGSVAINTEHQDIVGNIDGSAGSCTLIYTASSEIDAGSPSESHTVTYTIISN